MSMISDLVDRLRVEAKSMGTYGTNYMATLLTRSADTIEMLSEKAREPKEVVMPKKCKGCDSASKIIEAYSKGFEDGAKAVKAMPQTFTAEGIVFAKMIEPNSSEKPNNSTISKMEQVETMSCAECKHRPIGAEICEEPCHYEPQTDWHYDEQDATWYPYKHEDEPQTEREGE